MGTCLEEGLDSILFAMEHSYIEGCLPRIASAMT